MLRRFGFEAVTFSYPRNEPFGSSSLVYGGNCDLVTFRREELVNLLEEVRTMKADFPVLNPAASLREMQRHLRGEPEIFPCVGGYKYFYLDWNMDIWRCEAWSEPLGCVLDFERLPTTREPCTACTMSCYRDTSTIMHAALAISDAAVDAAHGRWISALRKLGRPGIAQSIGAVRENARILSRLGRRGHRSRRPPFRAQDQTECIRLSSDRE
ncbi:MAG: hypothetical protein JOY71_20625 [Acetobacteraceae bacterium]|nr:hypothetical protein [Acetobacteraceae bacterium]